MGLRKASSGRLWRSAAGAVAGISIGAITAAVLGGAADDPIRALDTLWRRKLTVASAVPTPWLPAPIDRMLATFGNPGMY
jgi:NTE family protein